MPLTKDVHIDAVLTQFALGYRNSGYIGDRLFPALPVTKESDKYWVFGTEAYRRISTLAADRTPAKRIGWTLSTDSYFCEKYHIAGDISDDERGNADPGVNIERNTVELVTDALLLDREMRIYDLAAATANVADHAHPSPKWDAGSTEDPIADVLNAKEEFRIQSKGRQPNLMILPPSVYHALQTSAKIVDQVKYTSDGHVTMALLQRLFEMDNIVMPGIMYDSTQEGDTPSIGDLWGDTVGLYYVDSNPRQKAQTYGLGFRSRAIQTKRWREEELELDVFEVSMKEDCKVVDPTCGFLLVDVLT